MSEITPARPTVQSRSVDSKRVGFTPEVEKDGDGKPRLIGQVYSLCGFPGQTFDEYWVRKIRSDYDQGFRPIMRRMVFRSETGGEFYRDNWGVSRYTRKQPAPPWELPLLQAAPNDTGGYFATLERPNLIDCWFPFGGMDAEGLPPAYQPFNGALMYTWFQEIMRDREAGRNTNALELFMKLYEEREAEKERDMDHEIDQRARDAVDMFPKFSTTNVAPTPRHLQLQES